MRRIPWLGASLTAAVFLAALAAQEVNQAEALYKLARTFQNAGNFADALKRWQQLVDRYPNDPAVGQAYQGLGTCSLETGDYERAIAAFGLALKKLPEGETGGSVRWNLAIAWQRRADQSKKTEHRQQVVEAFRAVLAEKSTPKDRQALAGYYLARADLALGKTDAARKQFEALLDNPADRSILPGVRIALARLAEDARAWPEAAKRYADFLQHHPQHASAGEARLGQAEAYFHLKQWPEAEAAFAAVKDARESIGVDYASFRWAELAGLRGDLAEAGKRWRQFLQQHPKSTYRSRRPGQCGVDV